MIGQAIEAVTERIRDSSDIVDVVGSYVTLRRAGKDFKGLCPFHNEKTPSFHVVPAKQMFHCFGCQAGGDVFKFIQLHESVPFPEARQILANRAGIAIDSAAGGLPGDGGERAAIERANRWAGRWFQKQFEGPAGRQAREYAAGRGLSAESLERFQVGFAPDRWDALINAADKQGVPRDSLASAGLVKPREDGGAYDGFRNRLMLPIVDSMDRVVGFGGRALGDDRAKYLNSPQNALFDKRRCLYGLSTAKAAFREARSAVLVEGYLDAMLCQQHGLPNTVATLGTSLTPEHVQILRRYVDNVVLVFDTDEAGQRAADRALQVFLAGQLEVRLATVPEGKDPAECLANGDSGAFERALTSAVGALEFKWQQVERRCRPGATGQSQRQAIEEFLALIAESLSAADADPIQRGLIVNQVGRLLSLPAEEIYRQLQRIAVRLRSDARANPTDHAVSDRRSLRVPDAADAATTELLEVLLNEPTYFDSIASQFDPGALRDPQDRVIGLAVVELAGTEAGLTLPALFARFESVETARRIADLQVRGERRGNHAATVEGAVTRLQQVRRQRELASLTSDFRDSAAQGSADGADLPDGSNRQVDGDSRSRLGAAQESVRQTGQFAARRHLAGSGAGGARQDEPTPAA